MAKPTINHCLNVGLIMITCLLAYLPGLTNFMLADDIPNIIHNDGIKITQFDVNNLVSVARSNDSGPLGRPISYLSFALNYYLSGQQIIPSHVKATNLGIHTTNSLLVYILTLTLLSVIKKRTKLLSANKGFALALFITLLWALHPIQLTAVLYSVQRMTSMATFFMLAGLITYTLGRNRLEEGRPYALTLMYGGIILGTALGTLCKEIALLLPFYAMSIELTLYNSGNNLDAAKKKLNHFFLIVAVIPAVTSIIYLTSHPQFVFSGYTFRDFTLIERLLTEARVLFYYIGLIGFPNLNQLSLHHDHIAISRGLFSPFTTTPALLGILFLLFTAWLLRKKQPVYGFMVIWFLVGHVMESTIIGLEIAYEHRNYLPSYSIIFGATVFSYLLLQQITHRHMLKVILAIAALSSMFFTTFTRATIWSEKGTMAHFDQRNHPDSARSQMAYAEHLLKTKKSRAQGYEHVRIAASLTATEVSPIIHLYKLIKIIEKDIDTSSVDYIENTTNPISYDAPLIINKKYIKELAILIDDEISKRLQGEIATHRAAMALRTLSYCILAGHPECTPVTSSKVINWLTIAISNPRHTDQTNAMIYYFLAKLKAYTGDIQSAFYYIDKSIAERPNDFSILIGKINLYLTVDDTENADKLIQQLEKRGDMPENFKRELNASKEYRLTLGTNTTNKNIPN